MFRPVSHAPDVSATTLWEISCARKARSSSETSFSRPIHCASEERHRAPRSNVPSRSKTTTDSGSSRLSAEPVEPAAGENETSESVVSLSARMSAIPGSDLLHPDG